MPSNATLRFVKEIMAHAEADQSYEHAAIVCDAALRRAWEAGSIAAINAALRWAPADREVLHTIVHNLPYPGADAVLG